MLAEKVIKNAKLLLALMLCVSFLAAAAFDERAQAEQQSIETDRQTQTSVPLAE